MLFNWWYKTRKNAKITLSYGIQQSNAIQLTSTVAELKIIHNSNVQIYLIFYFRIQPCHLALSCIRALIIFYYIFRENSSPLLTLIQLGQSGHSLPNICWEWLHLFTLFVSFGPLLIVPMVPATLFSQYITVVYRLFIFIPRFFQHADTSNSSALLSWELRNV